LINTMVLPFLVDKWGVGVTRDSNLKLQDLKDPHTLGATDGNGDT
jgi:hypothetical protein